MWEWKGGGEQFRGSRKKDGGPSEGVADSPPEIPRAAREEMEREKHAEMVKVRLEQYRLKGKGTGKKNSMSP